jgi:predicted DsbA family dithiol-disulfide isomerase
LRESNPDLPFEIRWHPFQLNPDLPAEGVDRKAYLEAKFGGPQRAKQVYERVMAAGTSVGIPFDFDAIKRQPNTLQAHRLTAWAQSRNEGDADALVEGLFRANFIEGRYVGSVEELVEIARAAGYDPADARAFLDSDELKDVVARSDLHAREMGIGGVPFFISTARPLCRARRSLRRSCRRSRRRAPPLDHVGMDVGRASARRVASCRSEVRPTALR